MRISTVFGVSYTDSCGRCIRRTSYLIQDLVVAAALNSSNFVPWRCRSEGCDSLDYLSFHTVFMAGGLISFLLLFLWVLLLACVTFSRVLRTSSGKWIRDSAVQFVVVVGKAAHYSSAVGSLSVSKSNEHILHMLQSSRSQRRN